MLKWKPKDRASARELLKHPWLNQKDEYNVWMSRNNLKEYKIVNHKKFPGYIDKLKAEKEALYQKELKAEMKAQKKSQL